MVLSLRSEFSPAFLQSSQIIQHANTPMLCVNPIAVVNTVLIPSISHWSPWHLGKGTGGPALPPGETRASLQLPGHRRNWNFFTEFHIRCWKLGRSLEFGSRAPTEIPVPCFGGGLKSPATQDRDLLLNFQLYLHYNLEADTNIRF